jgi:hypothetical protein
VSEELAGVVDPDIAPEPAPVAEVPAAEPPPQEAAPEPPAEDDVPDAVELQAGVKYVPVGALKAVREELKALKPQAQRAAELEAEIAASRPYVEFLKANPQLLQPQQPAQPQAPPAEDPALIEYAKTLDLYTQDGRPDTTRAAKLRDMTRQEAAAIAQQAVAPYQEQTHATAAAHNLQWMTGLKDANGQPLEERYIMETVKHVYGSMSKSDAVKILADPSVAQVLAYTALGRQAASKPYKPTTATQAPSAPPLHVESAGGNVPINVSEDHTRRLGVGHKAYVETAKRYVPGKSNILE